VTVKVVVIRKSAAEDWHTSSASGGTECVEVRITADQVQVRDTKNRHAAFLTFTYDEWQAFLAGVRLGEFDLPGVESA
jgi:hypothetical protein